MAKRHQKIDSSAVSVPPMNKRQKHGERSHGENQERAYIAASRRKDRSIEARMQSARMASAIHKERSGRGFKISEDILLNDDMYEEEEDGHFRHFYTLTGQIPKTSALSRQAALSHQEKINSMFADQFPHAAQWSQQIRSMCPVNARGPELSVTNQHPAQPSSALSQREPVQPKQAQGRSPSTLTAFPALAHDDGVSVMPALTLCCYDSGSLSYSASSLPTYATLFPSAEAVPDAGEWSPLHVTEFPVEPNCLENAGVSGPPFYSDGDRSKNGGGYSASPMSKVSVQSMEVPTKVPSSPSPFPRNMNILGHAGEDDEEQDTRTNGDGSSWEAWLHLDLMFSDHEGQYAVIGLPPPKASLTSGSLTPS